MTDLANIAAATTAGYKEVVTDYGSGTSPRFLVTLEKHVTGESAHRASVRSYGQGDTQVALKRRLSRDSRVSARTGTALVHPPRTKTTPATDTLSTSPEEQHATWQMTD